MTAHRSGNLRGDGSPTIPQVSSARGAVQRAVSLALQPTAGRCQRAAATNSCVGRGDLQQLSKEQLIELALRLPRPDRNSRTSSRPPSTDRKEKRGNSRPGGAKPGHEPHNRRLADDPDEVRDPVPGICEQCGGAFLSNADRDLIGEYDEIEIPPVNPYVIRRRRFACRCAHCGSQAKAPAPATTTPFGPRIHALAIYLKGFQALSHERLSGLFRDAFGPGVSEGALRTIAMQSSSR